MSRCLRGEQEEGTRAGLLERVAHMLADARLKQQMFSDDGKLLARRAGPGSDEEVSGMPSDNESVRGCILDIFWGGYACRCSD